MATHKSAIKRNRQNIKRRERNRVARSETKTLVKRTKTAATSGDLNLAKTLLRDAESKLARAGNKHLYHKKNVQRRISRLAKLVSKIGTAKIGTVKVGTKPS